MVLQADVAVVGARAALGFEIEFLFGDWFAFSVIGDFDVVEGDDGAGAVESDLHGVPLGAGFARFGKGFSE